MEGLFLLSDRILCGTKILQPILHIGTVKQNL